MSDRGERRAVDACVSETMPAVVGRLSEDDCLVIVDEDAALGVCPKRPCEDYFFEIFAASDEILYGVAVGYVDYVLSDDRSFIEVFGYVV